MIGLLSLFAVGCKQTFFGLVPWYQYLDVSFSKDTKHCEIQHFKFLGNKSDIPLILVALVDDLLRVVGILAIAFVLVGAVRYIYSQGDPEKTSQAQQTVINALIGLAVALVGVAFVSFIGSQLKVKP